MSRTDRLAIVAVGRHGPKPKTEQRVVTARAATRPGYQRFLRHLNATGHDIFVSMNPIRPNTKSREKADVLEVRRLQLDLDKEGPDSLRQVLADVNGRPPSRRRPPSSAPRARTTRSSGTPNRERLDARRRRGRHAAARRTLRRRFLGLRRDPRDAAPRLPQQEARARRRPGRLDPARRRPRPAGTVRPPAAAGAGSRPSAATTARRRTPPRANPPSPNGTGPT